VVLVVDPRAARADDDHDDVGDTPALRYVVPAPKAYLRTALEEMALLTAGLFQYFHTTGNSVDWDLPYSWGSLSKKLDGQAISFDTNRYDTNWLTHPAAGWLYYTAARGNRLDASESLFVTIAASTLWEFIGEYREQVSINDMIVTPMTGAVVGEATTQLAAWLDRGDDTLGRVFAWLFGPIGKLHDVADGATPSRIPSQRGWHEFRLTLGAASTLQPGAPSAYLDGTAALRTRIVRAPHYGEAGVASRYLTESNLSSLWLSATMSRGDLVDARVDADVAFAGYYTQDVRPGTRGGLRGYSTYVGAQAGFRYDFHDYDRAGGTAVDRLSEVDIGLALDQRVYFGPLTMHFTLVTAPVFASPTSHAIPEYVAQGRPDTLPSVARDQAYYYAGGGTLAPALELHWGPLGVRADARISGFRGIAARDRLGVLSPVALSDEAFRTGLRVHARAGPVELGASTQYRSRESRVADVSRRLSDSSWMVDTTFVF
jgi:hypothetical protein